MPAKKSPPSSKTVKGRTPIQPVPEKRGYEFGGPLGAFAIVFGLPILVYGFTFLCNDVSGCPVPSLLHPKSIDLRRLKKEVGWPADGVLGLFDLKVTLWVLAYYGLSLLLYVVLPGIEAQGTELDCGGSLRYKFNSFRSAVAILLGLAVGTYLQGASFVVWTFIWDNYLQIITSNLVICTVIALFVYANSFTVPAPGKPNPHLRQLAPGGHSGNKLYDFFIGRELNPRVRLPIPFISEASRTIDIKVWCEMRPGLLGWIILNLSNIARQYRTYGYATDSIILSTFFQAFYVLDGLYMEPSLLTTMDVIMDGFGFMLSFGDLVWVPFIYNFQTRYLAMYPLKLGLLGISLVLGVTGIGYSIFRGANNEKNRFRTNPNDPRVRHLKFIETRTGSRLITSGWWGRARHINYLGDWIMSWSYCLPTGISGFTVLNSISTPVTKNTLEAHVLQTEAVRGWGMPFTYFFMLYFGILLIHRERRDEEKCKNKYGRDWDRYTALVPYRIIPGIY